MTIRSTLRALRNLSWIRQTLVAALRLLRFLGYRPSERIYRHAPFVGICALILPDGGRFVMRSRGRKLENALYWEGLAGHEPASLAQWIQLSRSARTVFDIGSHAGLYTLAALAAGARYVHAFEPLSRVRVQLEENVALNRFGESVSAWPFCISDRDGLATLLDPGGASPGSATLSESFAATHPVAAGYQGIEAATRSVDSFCTSHSITDLDLIKIDVEGHEAAVLRGMRESVQRFRPAVLIEVLGEIEGDLALEFEHLRRAGYSWIRLFDGDGDDRNILLRAT